MSALNGGATAVVQRATAARRGSGLARPRPSLLRALLWLNQTPADANVEELDRETRLHHEADRFRHEAYVTFHGLGPR